LQRFRYRNREGIRECDGGVGALAAREFARTLIQFVPGTGSAVSAGVAGGTTWAMDSSAEKYFFDGLDVKPSALLEGGKRRFQ